MTRRGASLDTEALLLRATPYRDADKIVTLFTERLGKVSAVARAARSSRRRFGGTLEPFVHFRASLVSGSGELFTLRDTEPLQVFSHIVQDLQRVHVAAQGLVLLREVSPAEHAEPGLFASALRFLTFAEHAESFDTTSLMAFAMHVLTQLGTAPSLSACGRCGSEAPAGRAVTFHAASGALRCQPCGGAEHRLSVATRAWLEACQSDWIAQARAPIEAPQARDARRALGDFLAAHVHPRLASALSDAP